MTALDHNAHRILFTDARTHREWDGRPVPAELLRQLYDLMKWGPTEANITPARIAFVVSPDAKAKLIPCMAEGNRAKTEHAPATAILAWDTTFYEFAPRLMPHMAGLRDSFANDPARAEQAGLRSANLQAGYFIMAARSLGLDCGPMSGFDATKVNQTFFDGSTWRVNFICNLGYGDASKLFPRGPRLAFEEVCQLL